MAIPTPLRAVVVRLHRAGALTTLGSTALVVVTAAGHDPDPTWAAAQEWMAALSTNSSHRQSSVTHGALFARSLGAAQYRYRLMPEPWAQRWFMRSAVRA